MFNLNESLPWKQAPSRQPRNLHDVEETAYIDLLLATQLGGFAPFDLRKLVVGCQGIDTLPMIRSAHVRGRLQVNLHDVLRAAGAPRSPKEVKR
jgi:hypothetical protein